MAQAPEQQKTVLPVLSAAAFCVLLTRPLMASFVIAPAVTLWLFATLRRGGERRPARRYLPGACLLSLLFAALFVIVWLRTKRLVSLQFFEWRKALPILLAAAVGGVGAVPFLASLLQAAGGRMTTGRPGADAGLRDPADARISREDRRLLFCVALVSVSVCSLSSPLYPFNDWVDANCFFTVGKSMLRGIVPYRDLYEQKGPLLYALYALCYPISHRGFLGGWLLEIAAAWAFLSLAWKCHLLLTGERNPLFLFLTAALVYTAPAFLKGGSAEELALPLVMLSFWYGLRCLRLGRDLSGREAFLIGLSSGAVLWIKYSMLGFYLGFILVPAFRMLRGGRALKLLKLLGLIALGVGAASLPVLGYFAWNDALPDLWEAYFYNNIFVYGKSSSLAATVRGLGSGLASMLTYNDATVVLVLLSLVRLWKRGARELSAHVFLSFAFAFGLIYAGGINLKYYSEILCVFVPLGVSLLLGAGRVPAAVSSRLGRVLIPLVFTLALFGTENNYMLLHKRAEMPQFIFAETLKDEPDATLFNYGALDVGLFTTADLFPSTRYFCMLNLPSEEMVAEMEHYMADGVTDYIVSRGLEVDSPCYTLLQTAYFEDNGTVYPYYLYSRK